MRTGALGGTGLASPTEALLSEQRLSGASSALANLARQFRGQSRYPAEWSPYYLFANGEAGAWYDPSDFSTLFQDSAGTVPVTALGQPVGRVLDKSGRGNHLVQSSAASRPTVQARVNVLLATATLSTQTVPTAATPHTLSFFGTGTITLSGTSTAGPLVGTGVADRVTLTFTPTAGTLTLTISGTVTDAQLEFGSTATTYQRVTTATDYADVGAPRYLQFDGVDDSLVSAMAVDLNGPQVTEFAGVYINSKLNLGIINDFGANPDFDAGSFSFSFPTSGFRVATRGTGRNQRDFTSIGAPSTTVVTFVNTPNAMNSEQSVLLFRANGAAFIGTQIESIVSGGWFQRHQLFVGRRNQTSLPLNGRLHAIIIRSGIVDPVTITNAEQWVAQRTGVTLP